MKDREWERRGTDEGDGGREDDLSGGGDRPDAERAMTGGAPWEVLARYGRGDVSAEDALTLRHWAAADSSRQALLAGVRRLGELSRHVGSGGRVDAAWIRMQTQIVDGAPAAPVLRLEPIPAAGFDRYAEGRPWHRRVGMAWGAAAALVCMIALGGIHALGSRRYSSTPVSLREALAPRGARATLRLPDGTRVVLGPESRLRYATDAVTGVRNADLDGMAFFDVAHDAMHPFVVHASSGDAQAVGTSFSVRAYSADSVLTVVVANGRVALRSDGGRMGSGTMLEPGQRGVLRHGLVRVESAVDVRRELSWTGGQLVYDLVPLSEVARDLERWFDVRIRMADPSWARVRVAVTLDASSLDASLQRLTTVLDTKCRRVGRTVYLGS